jgi:uncharacterized protein with NAD-binding domain and iron-sulfur cluster
MSPTILILGGGVGGFSAAHELGERNFNVTVLEKQSVPGGKARSVQVPGIGTAQGKTLPGEHGFRFFPRFYKHVTDTMSRIPFESNRNGVFDNLVNTTRAQMALYDKPGIVTTTKFPMTLPGLKVTLAAMSNNLGIRDADKDFFAERCWQVMTSCIERRLDEYEQIGWWDFVGAAVRSPAYQTFFGHGLTRSLVAAKAQLASTKTIGDIGVQLLFDWLEPGGSSSDRVLNGPTNEVWIQPWLAHLRTLGVDYRLNAEVVAINCRDGRISSVTVRENGQTSDRTADYYVAAFPIEAMAKFVTSEMLAADPRLRHVRSLAKNVSSMNGIQFFLKQDVPLQNGHTLYLDSEWALTSISQHQFWTQGLEAFQGTGVTGILSVDISEWTTAGGNGKRACDCTRDEIAAETWRQLKRSLNVGGAEVLKDSDVQGWNLDVDIECPEGDAIALCQMCDTSHTHAKVNYEPLLVNLVDTWHKRPDSFTSIPNLFLASDYVRTNTDLATMEGANEAARRAVNNIIDASGVRASMCTIWPMHEPDILAPLREADRRRWNAGLAWHSELSPVLEGAVDWVKRLFEGR